MSYNRQRASSLLVALVYCGIGLSLQPAAFGADMPGGKPDFYAGFNGSLNAVDKLGHEIAPEVARGVKFVDGLHGKAVYVDGNGDANTATAPCLQYPASRLLDSSAGTLMFWVRPDWDGEDPGKVSPAGDPPFYRFIDGGSKFNLFMYYWLRFDIGAPPQLPADKSDIAQITNRSRGKWLRGDWEHVALSWDSSGWTRLYVNGLPYGNGIDSASNTIKRPLNFGPIDHLLVGSQTADVYPPNMRANAAFSNLKIYKHALPDDAIMADYRRFMPLDMTVERQYLRAGVAEKFSVDVWPGGHMIRPTVGASMPLPVKTTVTAALIRDSDGQTVARQTYPLVLNGQKTLTLPTPPLQEGAYRATYRIDYGGGTYQTSFRVFTYQPQPAAPISSATLKLGKPLVTIDCAHQDTQGLEKGPTKVVDVPGVGAYRESDGVRGGRFSYEIDLSAAAKNGTLDGHPMLIEVTWPDDKPRSMGLYLYRQSHNQEQRERLEGGIQSGDEIALSHQLQTASYLIYPWMPKYLFEARTLVDGLPAAVSKIVVRPVIGRLPKLAVHTPDGLPGRYFGHLDEDQSFDVLFAYDNPTDAPYKRPVQDMEMLLDYMDYTGQNILSYPFMRYGNVEYALPGDTASSSGNLFFSFSGWRSLMLDMMAARGKKVIATLNGYSVMEANKQPDQHDALEAQDYYQIDKNGKVVTDYLFAQPMGNPIHPLYRKQFMGHLNEILRRFGHHPALAGIDLWTFGDWQIKDLNTGYDDLTVHTFERETKISVPGSGPDRFEKRYAYLTGAKRREWLAWRAGKNTEILTAMATAIHSCNPKLTFGLSLGGTPLFGSETDMSEDSLDIPSYYYTEQSLDFAALRLIPGFALAPTRWPTQGRHQLHWNHNLTTTDEILDDMSRQSIFRGKGDGRVYSYQSYFESFNDSLKPSDYSSIFQNADVKPHGRFYLKELAEDVASADPSVVLIGSQPIGTTGRDTESQEFAQAFLALPAGDFQDIHGARDPVYARSLPAKQGIYVYLQNILGSEVAVTLQDSGKGNAVDLVSGQALPRRGNTWVIALKPFQLRSFKLSETGKSLSVSTIDPDKTVRAWYVDALSKTEALADTLRAGGGDTALVDRVVGKLRKAVQEDRLAEAHRLYFSKLIRNLLAQVESSAARNKDSNRGIK